jgi:hypothetical protein
MKELLFRLLKQQEDGSYTVVGYEEHEAGLIYHTVDFSRRECIVCENAFDDDLNVTGKIPNNYFIHHDRKDQYTGVTLNDGKRNYISDNGTKLFENDKIQYRFKYRNGDIVGIVRWDTRICSWYIENRQLSSRLSDDDYADFKITGVQGVNNES